MLCPEYQEKIWKQITYSVAMCRYRSANYRSTRGDRNRKDLLKQRFELTLRFWTTEIEKVKKSKSYCPISYQHLMCKHLNVVVCMCEKYKRRILRAACIMMNVNKKSCFFDGRLTFTALWGGLCVQASFVGLSLVTCFSFRLLFSCFYVGGCAGSLIKQINFLKILSRRIRIKPLGPWPQ